MMGYKAQVAGGGLLVISVLGAWYGYTGGSIPPTVVLVGCTVVATVAALVLIVDYINRR